MGSGEVGGAGIRRGRRPDIPGDIIGQRTAVNLQPPSLVLLGAQHIRMLEATHARIPQTAPMAPAVPPEKKPIIEKTELPHTRAVDARTRTTHVHRGHMHEPS